MRFLLPVALAAAAVACRTSAPPQVEPADPGVAETVRRIASALDYVAGDYAGAVASGRIVSQLEYDEQKEFLQAALELAAELPAPLQPLPLTDRIAGLRARVDALAPADQVATEARALGRDLRAAYGVVIAPAATPSRDRGHALYVANCTECHGKTGAGDGPRVPELIQKYRVPPRSLRDPDIMEDMTAVRVFNTLTDGVPAAGMPEFSTLTPIERWDLAFHVLALRHSPDAADRGEQAIGRAPRTVPRSASQLSSVSDRELDAVLTQLDIQPAESRRDAIAYLRRVAGYELAGAPMEPARSRLADSLALYRSGDRDGARREATAAYLDGMEPHEATLRRQDENLVIRIENEFAELRNAIDRSDTAASIEQRVLRLGALTETADVILLSRGGGRVAFVTAVVIVLREGIEAALLVLLILSLARGAGVSQQDVRGVHAGWLGALGAGIVTWFAAGSLIGSVSGASRELIEGSVAIAAALVLLMVSHFVLARLDARRRVAALRERLARAVSTRRRRLVLASLGFVAVYREAFETVLFLRALMLDAGVSVASVAGGAALGAIAVIGIVYAMARVGKRLKPAPLLSALGTLLCLVSVVLIGKGVRSLQEAGTLPITPLGQLRIDWLGIYPTTQTILAQLAIALAFAGVALWAIVRSGRPATR